MISKSLCALMTVFFVFQAAEANAAKKARSPASQACADTDKVVQAAIEALNENDAQGDATLDKTSGGFDEWQVDMSYNDICHRTVTVFMKAGTCKEGKKAKLGRETCTDD